MENIKLRKERYIGYVPRNQEEYIKFITYILKEADIVCFIIHPYLDNSDEFKQTKWKDLESSIVDIGFAHSPSYGDINSFLIKFKSDYFLYKFFMERQNIFDFFSEDEDTGLTMEDPAFIKDEEVLCYTVTHEQVCVVSETIYQKMKESERNRKK